MVELVAQTNDFEVLFVLFELLVLLT